ncbi:11S globulin seed storage protein 2-like [Wolffia australiana]
MGRVAPFLLLFLSGLAVADVAVGYRTAERRTAERKCNIQKISTSKPCCSVKSEGGTVDIWDENEDQFQCAGVFAMRSTINSESMTLPMYTPSPLLIYIQKGRALMGISYPGCPETFVSAGEEKERGRDQHQKIQRIQEGDAVAIPSGAVHWFYNDANEDLVTFSIADYSSQTNQLDHTARAFFLAGGQPKGSGSEKCEKGKQISRMRSILQALDANMMADAFGIPVDLAKKMQREDDRGFIVKVSRESMRMIRPTERKEWRRRESSDNGMEEIYCNMKIHHYLDNPMEADVFSKQTGRLNSVNMFKLPILRYIGMSIEKGDLKSDVLFGPHWSINAHTIVYVTRGGGRTQIVSDEGKTIFDENVKSGDVFVIPQFFASIHRAGSDGAEWVAFKTSPAAMRSPIAGHASVLKGMPMSVIASAFKISESQAQELKCNREDQMMMFTPRRTSPRIY